jgi:hypothetical protein
MSARPSLAAALMALALGVPISTVAQEAQQDAIAQLNQAIAVRDEAIRLLMLRMESLEHTVKELKAAVAPTSAGAAPDLDMQPSAPEPPKIEPPPASPSSSPSEQGEADQLLRTAFEVALIDRGGLLLPPYVFEVQPDFTYVHSSSDNVIVDGFVVAPVLVVGDIVSERVQRDSFITTTTYRMGLPWDLQAEIRVPYRFEREQTVNAQDEEKQRSDHGFGDVEVALSHQLLRADGWVPDLLAAIRWKTTTGGDPFDDGAVDKPALGTGFDALTGTLTAVKISDPVVLFGAFSYTKNFQDSKDIGTVDPGDSFGLQLGTAVALNLDTSINFGGELTYIDDTALDGSDIPGSSLTVGTFGVGLSYVINPATALDVGLNIGLTEDSPDVEFQVAVPVRFSLW